MADQQTGLVSVLGAFADQIVGPQHPVRGQLWLVARLILDDADFDDAHVIIVVVEYQDGKEQVARFEAMTGTPRPTPGSFDPDMPFGANLLLPMPLEFRRDGIYTVSLRIDGEVAWSAPLRVSTQLGQM
jgi:hypothetical protein